MVRYLRDVSAVLHLRSLATGTLLQAVRLPGLGSVEVSGRRASPVLHFSYNSLTEPGAIYTCAPRLGWARLKSLRHLMQAGVDNVQMLVCALPPRQAQSQCSAPRSGTEAALSNVGPATLLEPLTAS